MSLFVDKKFVSLLSLRLERFKQKNDYLWNFRCPICNDSKKNKSKARGFLYRKTDNIFYTCHNCGASMSLSSFLKTVDVVLHNQHKMETYLETNASANVGQPDFTELRQKPVFTTKTYTKESKLDTLLLTELPQEHPARQYATGRKIPQRMFSRLYYTDDFETFVNTTFPHNEKKLVKNDKRLIIPIFDSQNTLVGIQGRSITGSKLKYITVKKDESVGKVYGLDTVDLSQKVYVVEGPIDSMFLPNAIATMDANLSSVYSNVGDTHDYVLVFDNEPRNPHVVKFIEKAITSGKTVCIWPQNIAQKDINDMILGGMTPSEIKCVIDSNTFTGLKAKVQFDVWKKV